MDTDNIRIQKQKPSQWRAFIFTTSLQCITRDVAGNVTRNRVPSATLRPHYVVRTNWRDRMRLLLLPLRHEPLYAKFFAAKSQFTMFQ